MILLLIGLPRVLSGHKTPRRLVSVLLKVTFLICLAGAPKELRQNSQKAKVKFDPSLVLMILLSLLGLQMPCPGLYRSTVRPKPVRVKDHCTFTGGVHWLPKEPRTPIARHTLLHKPNTDKPLQR